MKKIIFVILIFFVSCKSWTPVVTNPDAPRYHDYLYHDPYDRYDDYNFYRWTDQIYTSFERDYNLNKEKNKVKENE